MKFYTPFSILPKKVKIGILILWVFFLLSVLKISIILFLIQNINMFLLNILFSLPIYIILEKMKQGKNWARYTYYIIWILGIFLMFNIKYNIFALIISILPGFISIFFLFSKEANKWFENNNISNKKLNDLNNINDINNNFDLFYEKSKNNLYQNLKKDKQEDIIKRK